MCKKWVAEIDSPGGAGCKLLNGPVTLKVPAGTPSGKTFRIKGKGAPRKSGAGDLMVTVEVDVPRKLSKEEKQLLQDLQEAQKASPRSGMGAA